MLADGAASDAASLLVCLSGGASAMLAGPAPGLTIEDKLRKAICPVERRTGDLGDQSRAPPHVIDQGRSPRRSRAPVDHARHL